MASKKILEKNKQMWCLCDIVEPVDIYINIAFVYACDIKTCFACTEGGSVICCYVIHVCD